MDALLAGSGLCPATTGTGAWLFAASGTDQGVGAAIASFSSSSSGLGCSVASGDFDGDGVADILLGHPGSSQAYTSGGAALVYYGPVSGSLSEGDADFTLLGGAGQDRLGWALGVGRLNTDGADDFVVGSYAHVGDVGGAGLVTSGSGL